MTEKRRIDLNSTHGSFGGRFFVQIEPHFSTLNLSRIIRGAAHARCLIGTSQVRRRYTV
jgi:hypothetical protein